MTAHSPTNMRPQCRTESSVDVVPRIDIVEPNRRHHPKGEKKRGRNPTEDGHKQFHADIIA